MNSSFFEILVTLFTRLPHLVLLVVGLVFALIRRRRAPIAMGLIAIGCGILVFNSIASQITYAILPSYFGASAIGTYFRAISMVVSLISTIGTGLILLGAFADRKVPEDRGFPVVFDQAPPASRPPPPL